MQGGIVPDSWEGLHAERGIHRRVSVGVFPVVSAQLLGCGALLVFFAEHRDVNVSLRVQADVFQHGCRVEGGLCQVVVEGCVIEQESDVDLCGGKFV